MFMKALDDVDLPTGRPLAESARQRRCLSHEGSGNTHGKGGALAKAVETRKAKAVSQPRRQWKQAHTRQRRYLRERQWSTQGKGGVLATSVLCGQREMREARGERREVAAAAARRAHFVDGGGGGR